MAQTRTAQAKTVQPETIEVQAPDGRIHGVTVIFDFGMGAESLRGKTSGNYSQSDVVDGYGMRTNEELDNDNVRVHQINTRRAPARSEQERLDETPANFLPLILSCDWHETTRIHNISTVEYCGAQYLAAAQAIAFALSEWGRCYVWGHRVSRPIAVSGDRPFIKIKPFALNGPHADEYLLRLDALGTSIGHAIGGHLLEKKMGRVMK